MKKLFILRKNYMKMPIKEMQDKLLEIVDYKLYDQIFFIFDVLFLRVNGK